MQLTASRAQIGVSSNGESRTLFTLDTELSLEGITAIVGENGVGKTTLLRTMGGFATPLHGSLSINRMDPRTFREREGVGYLPEENALPSALTGLEMLTRVWLAVHGPTSIDRATLNKVLAMAGVDFSLSTRIGALSHGMRQRLGLAAAMLPQPRLLLLDEPETGLDPAQRSKLRTSLARLASTGTAVVVSSHDISGLCLNARQLCLISNGEMQILIVVEGTEASDLYAMLPARWRP